MIIIPSMRHLITAHCLLITSCLILFSSCTPQTPVAFQTSFIVYRFNPSAFMEYSTAYKPIKEFPFSVPPNCGLNNTIPAPVGSTLLIELNCPNGQTVLFLDLELGVITQPITDTDAHFLAWKSDGKAAYLKTDSLGNPRLMRKYIDEAINLLVIDEFTYDLAPKPDSYDFAFTFSHGLGQGSEMDFAQHDGRIITLLYADQYNYISLARYSPDGKQIAFIKIPDSQTPFTVGELWIMNADGSNPRKLADVDAGHGYTANWSPDGKRIAYVVRENPDDEKANQLSDALISNIYIVDVETGDLTQLTKFENARVETPFWSPDGNTLLFNGVVDGRMNVFIASMESVGAGSSNPEIKPLVAESVCCPAWMRK